MADSAAARARLALGRGIRAAQTGQSEEARAALVEALMLDPTLELAWLWLAAVSDGEGERRYCLERALALNPQGRAAGQLKGLAEVRPLCPPELAEPDELPYPEEVGPATPSTRRRSRRGALIALLLVGVTATLGAWLLLRPPREAIYLAVVGPLSGPEADVGREMVDGVRQVTDRLNRAGGIGGRPLELLLYDDQNEPALARRRADEIVADGRALVVIGHNTSAGAIAAGEAYRQAGLPAITGSATADAVMDGNPWFFSTIFSNTSQGAYLATYARRVLGETATTVVETDDAFGQSLGEAYRATFEGEARPGEGGVRAVLVHRLAPAAREASLSAIVDAIADQREPGLLMLALPRDEARGLLIALRRRGVTARIIGGDTLGTTTFPGLFAAEPEEQQQPGYFTDGLYAVAPLLFDSASIEAQRLADDYRARTADEPSWVGAKYYDAALAATHAIARARAEAALPAGAATRERVRQRLADLNDPRAGPAGLDGPIYFEPDGGGPSSMAIGRYQRRLLLSAPLQLKPVVSTGGADLAGQLASGTAVRLGQQVLRPVRVVYTGMVINELNDLDSQEGTFAVDFFLWFRYRGGDDATSIFFDNAAISTLTAGAPSVTLGQPIEASSQGDEHYRLYRIRGTFIENLNFADYPFDTQTPTIRFQHVALSRDEIIYVVDTLGLAAETPADDDYVTVDNWQARGPILLFQDVLSTASTFGDPRRLDQATPVEFSRFNATMTVGRDIGSFLIRNALPLALMVVVLYVSLFFNHGEQTGDRLSIAVTGLLTVAVLQASIDAGLPEVGYTTAIEYAFYAFYGLSLACVVVALAGFRLQQRGERRWLSLIDHGARLLFALFVGGVVAAYLLRFAVLA